MRSNDKKIRVQQKDGHSGSDVDDKSRDPEVDDLITDIIDPLVRKILSNRLKTSVDSQRHDTARQDAEDLYQNVMLKATKYVQCVVNGNPEPHTNEIKRYVARIAVNVFNDYLRYKYPVRNRLKDRIRDVLKRHPDFTSWNRDGDVYGGFNAWERRIVNQQSRGLTAKSETELDALLIWSGKSENLTHLHISGLLAELFRISGEPIEIDQLVYLVSMIQGIKDQPVESIDDDRIFDQIRIAQPNDGYDRVYSREFLLKIWQGFDELTPDQRRAIAFTCYDDEGESLLIRIIRDQVVTMTEIYHKLEMSREDLKSILGRLPLDISMAAIDLGTTNQAIIKWRFRGLKKLKGLLGI